MKRLGLIGLLLVICLFSGCKLNNDIQHYVSLSIDLDKSSAKLFTFLNPNNNYIEINKNSYIYLDYFLIPETDSDIIVTEVISSDDNLISIVDVDEENKHITAYSNDIGQGKITIKTKNFYSSTTLPIVIPN